MPVQHEAPVAVPETVASPAAALEPDEGMAVAPVGKGQAPHNVIIRVRPARRGLTLLMEAPGGAETPRPGGGVTPHHREFVI